MRMPWGKYKGVSLEFINSGYFKYLLNQDWFLGKSENELLICAIEEEMNLRDMDNSHFYKDKIKL